MHKIETEITEFVDNFSLNSDFNTLELSLIELTNNSIAEILREALEKKLACKQYLKHLKELGGKFGLRFKEYVKVTVRVVNGEKISIKAPYFCKVKSKAINRSKSKSGKKNKRRKGNHPLCQLGLASLGFVDKISNRLSSYIGQMAVLCPSFEVCSNLLSQTHKPLDEKTIHKVCCDIWSIASENRAHTVADKEKIDLKGITVKVDVDGGRTRIRKTKRGRKKEGQKRQGYHGEWKEPKLFTIYFLDKEGKVLKKHHPFHDGTLGDADDTFELLQEYLTEIEVWNADRVSFCGDGAPWIWERVKSLSRALGIKDVTFQCVDYIHAKQNLNKIWEMLPKKHKTNKRWEQWTTLLWDGKITELREAISEIISKRNSKKAKNKFDNYFTKNKDRMQYKSFKEKGLPCGSGNVESAIRRVINLRLKAPGMFWKKENCEILIYLRSALLSGRWDNLFEYIRSRFEKYNLYPTTVNN